DVLEKPRAEETFCSRPGANKRDSRPLPPHQKKKGTFQLAHSNLKCNTEAITENLSASAIVEALPRAIIPEVLGFWSLRTTHGAEVRPRGEKRTPPTLGGFHRAPLPGSIPISEVDVAVQRFGEGGVVREFLAPVQRQGAAPFRRQIPPRSTAGRRG